MTSPTDARPAGPCRPVMYRGGAGRGFTLIEILVTIGILVVLAGLLLPAITGAVRHARRLATQRAFATISSALAQYKSDWGAYPPVPSVNSGAAVLCKALLGPYDAAHYYSGAPLVANDTLQNPPPAYDSAKTYQPGDVVLGGAPPTFSQFINASAGAESGYVPGIFVCTRRDTTAHATPTTPYDYTNAYWAAFLPYDGADGPGGKQRLGTYAVDASGNEVAPHGGSGKTYGPYLNAEQFHTSPNTGQGMALLDGYGDPILYFPINRAYDPSKTTGAQVDLLIQYDYAVALPNPPPLFLIYGTDNVGPFVHDSQTPAETYKSALARIGVMLGDYNTNGKVDAGEPAAPSEPFLLWSAGPDQQFGPRGAALPAATNWTRGDIVMDGASADQNRLSAEACDDVTNFRP